jgi:hypothetical protein
VAVSDNIDIPISYDLAFYPTDNMGPQNAEILIQLYGSHRTPTSVYQDRIRRTMAADYPNVTGYFQAADIVSEVLNFGLPAAIDVQVSGNDLHSDYSHCLASSIDDVGDPRDY